MSSRSQHKEPTQAELAQVKQELLAAQTQLQHLKSELAKTDIKKQRADESLAIYLAEVDARKHRADKEFAKLRNNYELDIAAYPDVLLDLREQKEAVMQSIADAIGELKVIQSNIDTLSTELVDKEKRKVELDSRIEEAERDLFDIEESISDKATKLGEINNTLEAGKAQREQLVEIISGVETQLTELRADLVTRKNAIEDDMKITIQKSSDVVKRMIELEQREAKINNDINIRIKAVELREQVMNRREAKISGLEAKAQEYARFMKL